MQCPSCGYFEIEEQKRDEILTYAGNSVTITDLKGHFCPACDDGVWDSESNKRLDEAQTALIDKIRSKATKDGKEKKVSPSERRKGKYKDVFLK
jgi:HTH-type transcriptional regulator/antitoxin MqsA